MFYCEECSNKNNWPKTLAMLNGKCEVCGKIAECYDHKFEEFKTVHPVQWDQQGYPIFTDPNQFNAWEKQRRIEIIEEIQDAFNEKAYDTMVEIYGAELKRLGDAIEKLEGLIDNIIIGMDQFVKHSDLKNYQYDDQQVIKLRKLFLDHIKNYQRHLKEIHIRTF